MQLDSTEPRVGVSSYTVGCGFDVAKATKTSGAAKVYWWQLKSLPLLEWTSESEYFESSERFFADIQFIQARSNHLTPCCACAVQGNDLCFTALYEADDRPQPQVDTQKLSSQAKPSLLSFPFGNERLPIYCNLKYCSHLVTVRASGTGLRASLHLLGW